MKLIITLSFIIILCSESYLLSGLLINEVVTGSSSDWVELFYKDEGRKKIDISALYVTMYYGTNEPLATEPITIYSYDRPETPYDDRYAVVHLTEGGTADETDKTGDTNHNGFIDIYCSNYYASLWNSDGVVAIDTDDDSSNGGIIDFIAYSNRDGSPNSIIEGYIKESQDAGQWQLCSSENIQSCTIDIGTNGLSSFMSISRKKITDTNTLHDFATTNFQTPGRGNIFNMNTGRRRIFRLVKKRISFLPGKLKSGTGGISLLVFENCNLKFRVFSVIGMKIYESPLYRSVPPGQFVIKWNPFRRGRSVSTALYIGLIEATASKLRTSQSDNIYIIVSRYK